FGAKFKSFERFGVSRPNVFGPSAVMEKRVLRADRRIIKPGRDRMSRCNLTARILKHVRHGALQNSDASATTRRATAKSRGMLAERIPASSRLNTDQSDLFVRNERMKQTDRIRAAADTGNQGARQFSGRGQNLFARFASNQALKLAHHQRIRMGTERAP